MIIGNLVVNIWTKNKPEKSVRPEKEANIPIRIILQFVIER